MIVKKILKTKKKTKGKLYFDLFSIDSFDIPL